MKKILIIYHGDCPDGFGGAWAAWKKFGNKAEYFAAYRDCPLPPVRGKEVYCVDFTPEPAAAVKKMAKEAGRLVLIDHHLTAKPNVELAPEFWFSLEHSAAVLAWRHFHPRTAVPRLLQYVEDADIWRFTLPHSKAVSEYTSLFPFEFKAWDKLARTLEQKTGRARAAEDGALLLRYQADIVRDMVRKARLVRFEGRRVYASNSSVFKSEIGHELALKRPPLGIVWREQSGSITVSLRSNGKMDVSKIAEKYGGGGHKAAASFIVPLGKKLPWR